MSFRKSFLVCCLVGLMLTSAQAQTQSKNPLEKFQEKVDDALPKGRFLKRLRDELGGSKSDEAKKPADQKSARQRSDSAHKTPTPTIRPIQGNLNAQSPTNPQNGFRRQPNPNAIGQSASQFERPQPNGLSPNGQSASQRNQPPYETPDRSKTKKSGAPKIGFGMQLEERDDLLIISNIQDHGNADAIGLRRGDRIVKIGGVAVANQKDFDEIAGVMGTGDQIQIVYERRGEEKEENLQFGDAPLADENTVNNEETAPEAFQFSKMAPGEINDFAPPIRSGDDDPELMAPNNVNGIGSALLPGAALNHQNVPNANRLPPPNNNAAAANEQQLRYTIQQQQQVIRELQLQVQQLQRQQPQKKNSSRSDR